MRIAINFKKQMKTKKPGLPKSASIAALFTALISMACTRQSDIDKQIAKYMETKGGAQIEEVMRKVLAEAAQGRAIGSAQSSDARLKNRVSLPIEGSPVIGDPKAKHTLVAFVDYADPFSSQVLEHAEKIVKERKGDLKLAIKFAPQPDNGLSAPTMKAVLLMHQLGKFAPYHDRVLGQRTSISQDRLVEWAKEVGVASSDFASRLTSENLDASLTRDSELLMKLGRDSTNVFLDGVRLERNELNDKDISQWLAKL